MPFTPAEIAAFWFAVWAAPVRATMHSLPAFAPTPDPDASLSVIPKALRPLLVQRWLAKVLAERLAWQEAWGVPLVYRFGRDSMRSWERAASVPSDREALREMEELCLRELLALEIECLARLLEARGAVSAERRLAAVTGGCARVAAIYAELRRRCKARQARLIFKEVLSLFQLRQEAA